MFGIIYFILCFILYILSIPILITLKLTKSKYKNSIPSRFFLKNNINFEGEVWIHACSLGEINSIEFLVNLIDSKIIITSITSTGYERAKELFGNKNNVSIKYLPFEIFIPFLMPKNLKQLIVIEAELWFMLFYSAKLRNAKTILLNARISNKSYPKYTKNKFLYKQIFKNIDVILCQQDNDKKNLESLGAKNVSILGNIKVFNKPNINRTFNTNNHNKKIIIAASTHDGEEELILNSYINSNSKEKYILILAPRHPDRFDKVWELILKYKLNASKFSKNNNLDFNSEIILLDKVGELINIYNIAYLVILGGSFVKIGGHNPIECAFFNIKLISGPFIFNQYTLFEAIEGYKIINPQELHLQLNNIESIPNSYIKNTDLKLNAILNEIKD